MKKIFLLLICVVILSIGGFFLYKRYSPREKADPFMVVPANAAIIIETSELHNTWKELKIKKSWQNLGVLPYVNSFNKRIATFDSLFSEERKKEFFKDKKILTSLHVVSSSEIDCIFYVPINSDRDEKLMEEVVEQLDEKKYKTEKREFNNYTITEIVSKEQGLNFSFLIYKNLFIGSYTPFLIEDVVRVINNKSINLFWKKDESEAAKLIQEKVTVHVKYNKLPELAGVFANEDASSFLKPLSSFAEESMMELNFNDKELHLNGFTYSSDKKNDFIDVFKGQKPQQFSLKNYIPNATSILYYYGFDNPSAFKKDLYNYWKKNDPEQIGEVEKVNAENNINIGDLYEDFGNEIGLSILESGNSSSERLLFIHSNDPERLFLHLSKFVTIVSRDSPGKLKNQEVNGIRIKQMNIAELPSKLFGKTFSGFSECYFAVVDDYVVFSNSIKNIKDLISDIDTENVWGKTLKINSSLGETITEFNIGFFVNISGSLDKLLEKASPAVKEEINKNKSLWQKFDFLAMQYSHLNETIFSNIVLTHNLDEEVRKDEELLVNNDITLDNNIFKQFYLVENKNYGKDLFFQDSLLHLYLLGQDGKIKWKNIFKDTIIGEVFTVDIDKDRNWEYLFAAGNKIYCYDTRGSLAKGFPFVLHDTIGLVNLSVIDYSNTKDYRIVASDSKGNVYIFNMKGEALDGWKPKKLDARLSDKVRHVRVGDKDIIIALQENGIINVMNRKGEMYPGFPVDLKSKTGNQLIIQKGRDFDKTTLTTLTESGQLITVDLNGKIIKKEQFPAASSEGAPLFCPDSKAHDFVIAKPSKNGFAIFNKDMKKLFDVNLNLKDVSVKYYNFSAGIEYFCIKDVVSNILYIYNREGRLIEDASQSSNYASGIFYNEKMKNYQLYNSYLKKVQLLGI